MYGEATVSFAEVLYTFFNYLKMRILSFLWLIIMLLAPSPLLSFPLNSRSLPTFHLPLRRPPHRRFQTVTACLMRGEASKSIGAMPSNKRYSSKDWFECLKYWPRSRILSHIRNNILAIGAWAGLLNLLLVLTKTTLSFPIFIHTISGSALSLLLVFKTNTSYDRFWEGRKLWGAVVGAIRCMSRLAYVQLDKSHHKELATLQLAYCISLRQHLRGLFVPEELLEYLHPDDVAYLASFGHKPIMVLRRLELSINKWMQEKHGEANPLLANMLAAEFRAFINILNNSMGGCERIVKAPAPYFYSINTSRFLSLFFFSLPLPMIPLLGWYTVPVIMAMSWCFIVIQEIGHCIEDPFDAKLPQLIPLNEIFSVIQANVLGTFEILF